MNQVEQIDISYLLEIDFRQSQTNWPAFCDCILMCQLTKYPQLLKKAILYIWSNVQIKAIDPPGHGQ